MPSPHPARSLSPSALSMIWHFRSRLLIAFKSPSRDAPKLLPQYPITKPSFLRIAHLSHFSPSIPWIRRFCRLGNSFSASGDPISAFLCEPARCRWRATTWICRRISSTRSRPRRPGQATVVPYSRSLAFSESPIRLLERIDLVACFDLLLGIQSLLLGFYAPFFVFEFFLPFRFDHLSHIFWPVYW